MKIVLIVLVVLVFVIPGVLVLASTVHNTVTGNMGRIGREVKGLWVKIGLGWVVSAAGTLFIGATYPLGRFAVRRGRPGSDAPPVVLVHGLYHNPSAWLIFSRWLATRGFDNIYTYGYNSFTRVFPEMVFEMGEVLDRVAEDNPGRPVGLVGHSLGGLVCRGALGIERHAGTIGAVATLGTPHNGSALGVLGFGRLARSLRPSSELFSRLEAVSDNPDIPKLSFYAPVDNMVFPEQCLRIDRPGWTEEMISPVCGHVSLVYQRFLADGVARFFFGNLKNR